MSGLPGREPRGKLNRRTIAQRLLTSLAWIAPISIGLFVMLSGAAIGERMRDLLFDEYQRVSPRPWSPDLPVRIIDIDDEALAKYGQWPWPRTTIADLTSKLAALEPAVIAFDILFAEDDRLAPQNIVTQLPPMPERDALARALARRPPDENNPLVAAMSKAPVVNAFTLIDDIAPKAPVPKTGFVILGDDPANLPRHFAGAILPLPDLAEAGLGLGVINYIPDRDFTIRRAPLVLSVGPKGDSVLAPSLALEALRVAQFSVQLRAGEPADSPIIKVTGASLEPSYGGEPAIVSIRVGDFEIPTERDGQVRIRYAGTQPGRHISAASILSGAIPRSEIEGRILIVGATAASLGDIRSSAVAGAVPGVEIHAELLEHIVSGANLSRPDIMNGVEAMILLLGGLLTAFLSRRLQGLGAALSVLLMIAVLGCASWWAFSSMATLVDPLIASTTWLATWGASTVSAYRRTERERRDVRTAFSRYLAPAVVERLAMDPAQLKLGGEQRPATVMFCDARGFTARSEYLDAKGVVDFLNSLMTPLTDAVLANRGTIDKYMGDGLMAFWNAPLDVPDHAACACRVALEMQQLLPAINAVNATWAKEAGRPHIPITIGIGLNTGDVFVGNMGSEQRFDYSIIGDPVNVASRLEASTKEFRVPIVVSESTMQAANGFLFLYLGAIALRGRREPTRVFALHAEATADDPDFKVFQALHERLMDEVEAGRDASHALAELRLNRLSENYTAFYDSLDKKPIGSD